MEADTVTNLPMVMNHQSTTMVMVTNHQPTEATNPLKDLPIQQQLLKMRAADVKAKGQSISEHIYGVLNFPKMQRNIARISALKVS